VQGVSQLEDVLPQATLQSVKELFIDCYWITDNVPEWPPAPEWPTSWSQLTNLTKLSTAFKYEVGDVDFMPFKGLYHFPVLLTEMSSLKDICFTTDFEGIDDIEQLHVPSLVSHLPQLRRLQIDVVETGATVLEEKKVLEARADQGQS